MSAASKPETDREQRALATRERLSENLASQKERNAMIAAIRGTLWGRDVTPEVARYVAQYCRDNNLDVVRHVELLGGRIYLTAALFDEKGAHSFAPASSCRTSPIS